MKTISPLELRELRTEDQASFVRAINAFDGDATKISFAFDYDANEAFSDYLKKLDGWTQGINIPDTWVPNSYLVGVVDGEIVGRVSLRHRLNDLLRQYNGHIGYAVIPSERRKGYASAMLQQALARAAALGIEEAMVSCDIDNIASRKTIEGANGRYHATTDLPELEIQKHIYWIPTQPPS